MEYPVSKRTSRQQLRLVVVIASLCVVEDPLADGNRPLDQFADDLFVLEGKVHHVEVVVSVDHAHVGNPVDNVVSEDVPVTLNDCVYCPIRKGLY